MWIEDLPDSTLESETAVPLHHRLREIVRRAIDSGELPPGSRLPTEAEFQGKFGISRSVVRQALSALTNEGLIQRGRGRGSVVAPIHEHHRSVQKMTGLSAQMSTTGGAVATEVKSLGPGCEPRAASALGTRELIAITRRRSIGGEPIAIIHTWLPKRLVPELAKSDLIDASLHEILGERFGIPVSAGHRQVRAVSATNALAEEISVPSGAPLLVLEGTSLNADGEAIEYFRTWHRADRVVFDVEATVERQDSEAHSSGTAPGSDRAGEPHDLRTLARSIADQMEELVARLPRV